MLKRIIISAIFASMIGFLGVFFYSTNQVAFAADDVTCADGSPAPDNDTAKCITDNGAFSNEPCGGGTFLGFPKWYKYLPSQRYDDQVTGRPTCLPVLNGLNSIWRIVAAVIELLLRVGALVAVAFVLYGGITYTLSQANPDKTKQALKTIISALVGLVISIISTALVTFLAGRF